MSCIIGSNQIDEGLVFSFDKENFKKCNKGQPTTNLVTQGTLIGKYNNPGFLGQQVATSETLYGETVRQLDFSPNDATYIARLGSTEGFGANHGMAVPLQANTYYIASIYFKTNYPLSLLSSEGFNNTPSNIGGWGGNGTTSTRYKEGEWTRLYTQFYNNTYNGYASRPNYNNTAVVVNTTATTDVIVSFTMLANGGNIADFTYLYGLYNATPTISNNAGLTGLAITAHGLNTTTWDKLSTSNIVLKASLPLTYYVKFSVPSTSGVDKTISYYQYMYGLYTAVTDSKYWKITFDVSNLAVGTTIKTYWACPMLEVKTSLYPSTYTAGTRGVTQSLFDLTGKVPIDTTTLSWDNVGEPIFNGTTDRITSSVFYPVTNATGRTWEVVVKPTSVISFAGIFGHQTSSGCSYMCDGGIGINGGNYAISWYDGASYLWCNSTTVATSNQYAHIIGTYDSVDNMVRIYVNGVLQATSTATNMNYGGTIYLQIMGYLGNTGNPFTGEIAIAKHYMNKTMTANEVSQSFNAIRSRFSL